MNALRYIAVETSAGWCAVCERRQGLWRSCLPATGREDAIRALELPGEAIESDCSGLLAQAAGFLTRFFSGEKGTCDIPLDLRDQPEFTRKVLLACSRIPPGQVLSYGELATQAGQPKAARAVGQVMHRNPLAPFVPCHRVVGSGGDLTGFGAGLEMKARMLRSEGWRVVRSGSDRLLLVRKDRVEE